MGTSERAGRRHGRPRATGAGRPANDPETVQETVLAAAAAYRLGDAGAYARHLAVLALDGDSPQQGSTLVGQVIERVVDGALAAAWERGWQPADVERLVRRRLRRHHGAAVVAAIAHQHRRYAAATVADTWRSQLRAMGADPRNPPVGGDVDGTARPVADDHQATIEVLSLLRWLPVLPRLGPLPGEARSVGRGGHAVDGRVFEKVRALLAKAESTTFVEEAEAFTAKAQELMARHAVDLAMLQGGTPAGGAGGRRIGVDDPYAHAKSLLLAAVARANRCRSVWTRDLGFSTVFGHESDLDAVDLLYTSLLVQATTALAATGRRTDRSGRSRTRSFRSSFLVAYANRIGQRLCESAATAEAAGTAEHGAGLVPVMSARRKAVDDAVESTFPDVGSYSVSVSNGAGWAAGTAAAEMARLSAFDEVRPGQASA